MTNVRFGSLADMRSAKGHVREVPKADIGKKLVGYSLELTTG